MSLLFIACDSVCRGVATIEATEAAALVKILRSPGRANLSSCIPVQVLMCWHIF